MRLVLLLFYLQTITTHPNITHSEEHHSRQLLFRPGGGLILRIPGRSYRGGKSDNKQQREIEKRIKNSKGLTQSYQNKKVVQKTGYPKLSFKRLQNQHIAGKTNLGVKIDGTHMEKGNKRKSIVDKYIKSNIKERKKFLKKKKKREYEVLGVKPETEKNKMRTEVRLKSDISKGISKVSNSESPSPDKLKLSTQNYSSFWSYISSLLVQQLNSSQSQETKDFMIKHESEIFHPAELRWEPKKIHNNSGTLQIR